VAIPFFAFRIMVGCGIIMLLLAWVGTYLSLKKRLERNRALLWCIFWSFPLPFFAILTGWFTAEVGRQPWTIYGLLRTADAVTPILTTQAALSSLVIFCALYAFIGGFGLLFIYRLLRAGPGGRLALPPSSGHGRQVPMGERPFTTAPPGFGAVQVAHHIINDRPQSP
jgi:cytochrome d ubiquinol oxidase subunit I